MRATISLRGDSGCSWWRAVIAPLALSLWACIEYVADHADKIATRLNPLITATLRDIRNKKFGLKILLALIKTYS